MLPADWEQQARQIAGHCAVTHRGNRSQMNYQDRFNTAYDAIIELVHDHGWPVDDKDLFRTGANSISMALYNARKHVRNWAHWVGAPAAHDSFADRIVDYVAVVQLLDGLTAIEREAIVAYTFAGSYYEAANLLGLPEKTVRSRCAYARRRARQLWVAPGDTPVGPFHPGRSKATVWRHVQTRKIRQAVLWVAVITVRTLSSVSGAGRLNEVVLREPRLLSLSALNVSGQYVNGTRSWLTVNTGAANATVTNISGHRC